MSICLWVSWYLCGSYCVCRCGECVCCLVVLCACVHECVYVRRGDVCVCVCVCMCVCGHRLHVAVCVWGFQC